jgi:3-methyladenine DNA glycosylase AlkD
MTLKEAMTELEKLGSEQTRKIYTNHGCQSEMFGVSVANLKIILKQTRKDHELALKLYETGNADAQYLAGLMADSKKLTKAELQSWAKNASWYMVSEYAVAWNVAESPFCIELCEEWINSENHNLQQIGWASLSSHLGYEKRNAIDAQFLDKCLTKIEKEIHSAENRVRYTMNGFIIALGAAEPEYFSRCQNLAKKIGKVEVHMGKTACKVPEAVSYLEKIKTMGRLGIKKKTMKC